MDSLTHIASGALIGEAFVGKALGKRAMIIGATAQSLPGIDFVASFWLETTDDLITHRGITHSFLFAIIASASLGFLAWRVHKQHDISLAHWIFFFLVEIGTHLFLDAFNNYGVGWFEPFSHLRISFNTVFVVDPFYTIPLVVCFIVLIIKSRKSINRLKFVYAGLMISSLYLGYALFHKYETDTAVRKTLAQQHIPYDRYFTTPAAFNNWLWYIVTEQKDGFQIAFRSVFDSKADIKFHYFPKNENLIASLREERDVSNLLKFSQGYFTVQQQHDTLVFNDLRFGQVTGWTRADNPFVFHFYINYPEANLLVVQRGRFSGWDRKSFGELVTRIKGN